MVEPGSTKECAKCGSEGEGLCVNMLITLKTNGRKIIGHRSG